MHGNNETGVVTDVGAIAAALQCARNGVAYRRGAERRLDPDRRRGDGRRAPQLLRAQARRPKGIGAL
jgi:hypothetical protein